MNQFILLNCSSVGLCVHSFGLDPCCKRLTFSTLSSPNEHAGMDQTVRRSAENTPEPPDSICHYGDSRERGGDAGVPKTGGPTSPDVVTSNTCASEVDKLCSFPFSRSACP